MQSTTVILHHRHRHPLMMSSVLRDVRDEVGAKH